MHAGKIYVSVIYMEFDITGISKAQSAWFWIWKGNGLTSATHLLENRNGTKTLKKFWLWNGSSDFEMEMFWFEMENSEVSLEKSGIV